ncbi:MULTISPECIES: ABC transporter permease [Heyndrickxia]|jgi:hypothetical protein|uniref:ABC transporter permease n=1 Tax=Heyndrickxia TaxID=2837504 RepID=UPI001378F4D7|nr:ABC transporter permease [Heyndrickxia coagulans]MED4344921.1 ABC transporter permease [Heyndrickxia coagulans]NCG67850.1 hypothetical protein [Heyndrickxia coagulans]UJZ88099.1 ABC transporter permease [Heyndrickxia coagulans]
MNHLKVLWLDFNSNKKSFIIFFVLKVIIIFMISLTVNECSILINGLQRFNSIDGNKVYVNTDSTSDQKVSKLMEESDSISRMKDLYDFVSDNFTKYSYWDYPTGKFAGDQEILQASTDLYFFELFNIKTVMGRNFTKDDLTPKDDNVPIIVGFELKDKYKLNHTYNMIDPNTGEKIKYKVVGVLKNNESRPSFYDIGYNYSLNYTYFRLLDTSSLDSFANLDMALGSLVVFSKDAAKVKEIEKKSAELNLFDMNFQKVSNNVSNYLKQVKKGLFISLSLLIGIIVIAILTTGNKILLILKANARDYLIRMCCGATARDLFIEFFLQLSFLDLIALLPTIVYIVKYNSSPMGLLIAVICNVMINMVLLSIPLHRLKKQSLISFARSEQ